MIFVSSKNTGRIFGARRSIGKPRGRGVGGGDAACRDAIDLLQIRKGNAAARNREGWKKEFGDAMIRKSAPSDSFMEPLKLPSVA